MALMLDARVPVVFGSRLDAWPDDAVLQEGLDAAPDHPAGCACCVARTPAAEALSRLFMQRARGESTFFRRVLVVCDAAGQSAVRAALQSDPVVAARFRLA